MNYDYELGVIGGGNMAEATVRAAVDRGVLGPERVIVSDPAEDRRALFERMGIKAVESNADVIERSAFVMLAVKPQALSAVAGDLRRVDVDRQVVMSIMAGVPSAKIAAAVGGAARVVRIMPNTPLMAGCGMSAIAPGAGARRGDERLAMAIFAAAGEAVLLDEEQMDAVTAVSGSGPAYVFYLAEAMAEAARSLGLDADQADLLTRQTILGAAKLMRESSEDPADLRRKVTSPGGTTEAAIHHLDAHEVGRHILEAVRRAAERSRELGG